MTNGEIISYLIDKCEDNRKQVERAKTTLPDNDGYFPGKLAAYESMLKTIKEQDFKDSCAFYVLRNHWLVRLAVKLKIIKL